MAKRQKTGPKPTTSLNQAAKTFTIIPEAEDLLVAIAEKENEIQEMVSSNVGQGIKWHLYSKVTFQKDGPTGQVETSPTFRSNNVVTCNPDEVEGQLASAYQQLYARQEQFQREGSGWSVKNVESLSANMGEFVPLEGSSYVDLPGVLKAKGAIVNVENRDSKCFLWSVLAHLHPADRDPNRVSKYTKFEYSLNTSGISFPTPLKDIVKFEKNNNISINVFGYESEVFPLQITAGKKETHVNLLLFNGHYTLIRNFSRLMGNRTKNHRQTHYCVYCLHGFIREDLLREHEPNCSLHGVQKINLPKDKILKFSNMQNMLPVPFVIYADFESYTEKIGTCSPDPTTSFTKKYQQHTPSGFGYKVVCRLDQYTKDAVVYRGENVVETFLSKLLEEERYIYDILNDVKPMNLSSQEEEDFQNASVCFLCQEPLPSDRVRDHDHMTGDYRGAAHAACNLKLKYKKDNYRDLPHIPIVFHNLRGYDSHLIMADIGKFKERKLSCIANNFEKYVSFSFGNLRFIDSLQFLNTSLENLVSNLNTGTDKFKHLNSEFDQNRDLLLRKGVYPYDYVDGPDKLQETELPKREHFFNLLKNADISIADYEHAKNVWQTFRYRNLGDYHDLYLKTDVLLLADVFENFRTVCLESYQLDPAHYYTSPGLSWDAMLKYTKVKLELLDDIDAYLMVESGLRGGICMISNKYAKANNPYLEDFDIEQPKSYISYLDANNLYGWAMTRYLPEKEFKWMSEAEIAKFDVMAIPDDSSTGYILEVDLQYPQEIHDEHSDYPLAPETLTVEDDMLSPYSLGLKEQLKLKGKPLPKLVPNLKDKEKYVVHYQNLKFYSEQGMKMTKIHRVLKFRQSAWLKPYIDLNTDFRKNARNDFEKDFYKLLNNSVFGKTMENLRKRTNMELVHTAKRFRKLVAKPSFHDFKIFNEELTAVQSKKVCLTLNKPIYVGFAVLDLSKVLMYDFHYRHIKPRYDAKLLFTDTDSLCYHIVTEDVYKDFQKDSDLFDFSNYPVNHSCYSVSNKKVLGKMKDETASVPIAEFVGLRSKMYSMSYGEGEEKKTAKGISKVTIKQDLRHVSYKNCLFNREPNLAFSRQIRSLNHVVFSMALNKVGLSPYDDKRYVLDDGVSTLAHGHYKVV